MHAGRAKLVLFERETGKVIAETGAAQINYGTARMSASKRVPDAGEPLEIKISNCGFDSR